MEDALTAFDNAASAARTSTEMVVPTESRASSMDMGAETPQPTETSSQSREKAAVLPAKTAPGKDANGQQTSPQAKPATKPLQQAKTNGNGQQQTNGQENGWKALKEKAKEFDVIKPQLEKLQADIAERETKLAEAEKRWTEAQEHITEAKTLRMMNDLEGTPEYLQNVGEPYAKVESTVEAICKRFGLNFDSAWDIISAPDPLDRAEQLFDGLQGNPKATIISQALQTEGDKLAGVMAKKVEMEKHAEGLHQQYKTKVDGRTAEQKATQEREYKAAKSEVWDTLKDKFEDMFGDESPEVKAMLQEAEVSEFLDTPMDRALAARLPHVTNALSHLLTQSRAKVAELEQSIKDMSEARPGGVGRPGNQSKPAPKSFGDGLDEAAGRMRAGGWG